MPSACATLKSYIGSIYTYKSLKWVKSGVFSFWANNKDNFYGNWFITYWVLTKFDHGKYGDLISTDSQKLFVLFCSNFLNFRMAFWIILLATKGSQIKILHSIQMNLLHMGQWLL